MLIWININKLKVLKENILILEGIEGTHLGEFLKQDHAYVNL